MRSARRCSFALIVAAQFGIFEAALAHLGQLRGRARVSGTVRDRSGDRLPPEAARADAFTTSEFAADIAINGAGFRDDEELGPKAPNERRIVLLGDSLVLSVQVPFRADVRRAARAAPERRGVGASATASINAGVQGYGPVEEQLFFRVDRRPPCSRIS